MSFVPLHVHSHFSLLDGLSKADQIAARCAELGHSACALTDHGSISGAATFMIQCKKQGVKPIIGCEFYVTESAAHVKDINNIVSHQVILAKNLKGWYKLIQLVSRSNDKENFYYKPRTDIEALKEIADDDLISFSGHLGSTLHRPVDAENYALLMQEIFGKDNFFLEVQLIDGVNEPQAVRQADKIRQLSIQTGIPCIATCDAHYPAKKDAVDQRVLLCSSMQTTLQRAQKEGALATFFNSENFHIPSYEEMMRCGNTPEEIKNTTLIADMCDNYDITGPPKLPSFPCPDNANEDVYLRELCKEGWYKYNKNWDRNVYGERVRNELAVIKEADLAGYFLIVQDYVNWAKNQGWLVGPGRGSGAGSIVCYLLGITSVDPLPHGLLFERFYNAGRNTGDRVSLPDIDIDFPVNKRKFIIEYLKGKYGNDRVCQMATFGRMQGRGALKEVLRVNDVCDFETMNKVSQSLPKPEAISDQLEDSGETSIIRWTLLHDPDVLSDWCRIEEDGTLTGDYSEHFEQAIRLEGTYKSQGKHAAGVVISAEPLDKVCPMINDKNSSEKIAGMSMEDLESMGHTKFDILGLAMLDKLMGLNNLLQTGKINP